MMKNKNLLSAIVLMAAVTLTACSERFGDNEASHSDGRTFYVKVAPANVGATRTMGTSQEADTEEESAISDTPFPRLYLVDPSTKAVTYLNDQDYFSVESSTAEITLPASFTSPTYLLYADVNWSFNPTTTDYSSFVGAYTPTNITDLWKPNYFMMANVQNDINVGVSDPTPNGGVAVSLGQTVTIPVERLAAKVVPCASEDVLFRPVGLMMAGSNGSQKLTKMFFRGASLINCVKSFNHIQQWKAGQNEGEKVLVTPSSSTSYSLADGYYNRLGMDELTYSDLGMAQYCAENNSPYFSEFNDDPSIDVTNPDAVVGTKMKGRVTGIVFRVQAALVDGESETEELILDGEEGSWLTESNSASNAQGRTRADEDNGLPELGTGESFSTFYGYRGAYYTDVATLKSENSALADVADTPEALRANGVSVYEDGYMYYTWYILDQNYTDGGNHYLSVMRNTRYRVEVSEISAIGDDVPGGRGYEATDPINVNGPLIKVALTISAWNEWSVNYVLQ